MSLPDPVEIVLVFLAIGFGLWLIVSIIGSFLPSLYAYLVLLDAIRSGKCVVQIKQEDGDTRILIAHEDKLEQLEKLREVFCCKEEEF